MACEAGEARGPRSGNRPRNPLASAGGGGGGAGDSAPSLSRRRARSSAVRHGGFRGPERQNMLMC